MFADDYTGEAARVVWGKFISGEMVNEPDGWSNLAYEQEYTQEVLKTVCSALGYPNYLRYRHSKKSAGDVDRAFKESRRVLDKINDVTRAYVLENGIRLSPEHEEWLFQAYLDFKAEEGVTYTMEEKQVLWASVDALL
jgi:hypothetical protein